MRRTALGSAADWPGFSRARRHSTLGPHLRQPRSLADLYDSLKERSPERRQRLYPVLDEEQRLLGVLPFSAVLAGKDEPARTAAAAMIHPQALAHADEILRPVADRMAARQIGVIPVVDRADPERLDGLITQFDLLRAREKLLIEERRAERVLALRGLSGPGSEQALAASELSR